MAFFILRRPTLNTTLERWAQAALSTAQEHQRDALAHRANAELLMAKAVGADALARMYENRAKAYRLAAQGK